MPTKRPPSFFVCLALATSVWVSKPSRHCEYVWCSVFLKPFRKKRKRACDKQRLQLSRRETSFLCPILRFFFHWPRFWKTSLSTCCRYKSTLGHFLLLISHLRGGGGYFHAAAHGNKSYHFYQLVPGWGNIRDRPEGRAGGGLYPPLFRKNKNKLDKNNGAKNSPPTKNLLRGPWTCPSNSRGHLFAGS